MSQLAVSQRCVIAQSRSHVLSGFTAVSQLCSRCLRDSPAQLLQKLPKSQDGLAWNGP